MKYVKIIVISLAGLIVFNSCLLEKAGEPADLILFNGKIYTVDNDRNTIAAMAVRSGRILALGIDSQMKKYQGPATRMIDLESQLVLPGFIDSHAHAVSATKQLYEVDLYGLTAIDKIQAALKSFRELNPDVAYIKGRGWSNADYPKTGPNKQIIDEVINDIPVALSDDGGHAKWVNSKAFELAGITADTPDPEGGVIERYMESGEPSGTLRENASSLVSDLFPYYGFAELRKGLLAYQEMALSFGITSAHDSYLEVGIDEIPAYQSLEADEQLNMRFRAGLYVDPDRGIEQIQPMIVARSEADGQLFRIISAKVFIDGVVEGSTAYLNQSYEHIENSKGTLLWDLKRLNRVCAELDRQGFQIHVHAIGDAATRVTLDALEYIQEKSGIRDSRHSITHLQLVSPADILRFSKLGVVAVPQPFWFMKDDYYHNIQVPYLGQERADAEYPMGSFFRAGVTVASSSDFPVTIPCNPLDAIETGITRQEPGANLPGDPLWPEERASIDEMISSFTINGAYANFLENETGSLEIGKSADFIILDRDIFQVPVNEIHQAKVLDTYFQGQKVYSRQ